MSAPNFVRAKVPDENPLQQFNVQLRRSDILWIKRTANQAGKKQSVLVREIMEWARDEVTKRLGVS